MAKRRVSGLKPFTVIQHPTTGAYYLVGNGYLTPGTDCVRKIDILPIEDVGHSRERLKTPPEHYDIYASYAVEEMRLKSDRQYRVNCKPVDFSSTFGMSLEPIAGNENPAKDLLVETLGRIETPNITGGISKTYENIIGRPIQSYLDAYDMSLLQRGRAASILGRNENVLPVEKPLTTSEDTTPNSPDITPAVPVAAKPNISDAISKIAAGMSARAGNSSRTPRNIPNPSTEDTPKPLRVNNLASLGKLFADKSLETKLNPADFSLLQAVERVGYSLSDLTMHVIAGETIMGSSNPQWILKDSAPQNSPFRGQSLNLQDVFDLFANENISERDISKSINFAGPKVASEITAMIRDPQFRSQFDIK